MNLILVDQLGSACLRVVVRHLLCFGLSSALRPIGKGRGGDDAYASK
jgi:hypothetical protein